MSQEQNDEFLPDDEQLEEVQMEENFSADDEFAEEVSEPFAEDGTSEETLGGDMEEAVEPESEESEAEEEEKPIMYRPPRMDLYTVLLALSLVFILLATAIHYLECPSSEYGTTPFKKNSPKVSAPN